MNTAQFAAAPKVDPRSPNCVRYAKKAKRFELVVGGTVTATISRFAMSIPNARRAFDEKVRTAAAAQSIDELVERLYPDDSAS